MIEQLQMDLYAKLIENCPKATGNMSTNIYLYDYGEYFCIKIETFYAKFVNYNRRRTAKEYQNFHWVEKTLREVSETYGGNIIYELY